MYGKVSVIMPNYNCEEFLEQTIMSVVGQTYDDWELLIVDDCSTDGSVRVIERLQQSEPRIKLFVNETNRGAAYSRNVALREATGQWMAFLDSDDMWLPEKLERQLRFLVENDRKFGYTYYAHVDEQSQPLGVVVKGPKKITKRKMFRYCYVGCLTVIYDRTDVGVVQIADAIANGENDYAIWLKIAKKHTCYLLPEVLSLYRVRGNSLSHKSSKCKLMKNHYKLFRIGENKCAVSSFFCMLRNVYFGFWKKVVYIKKVKK